MDLTVSYGIEPEPFFPSATNELNAVTHHLAKIGIRLNDVADRLFVGHNEVWPDEVFRGMINELAMLNERVNALLQAPPDDGKPGYTEFTAALDRVEVEAGGILEVVAEVEGLIPGDQIFDGVRAALLVIETHATTMVEMIEDWRCPVGTICGPDLLD